MWRLKTSWIPFHNSVGPVFRLLLYYWPNRMKRNRFLLLDLPSFPYLIKEKEDLIKEGILSSTNLSKKKNESVNALKKNEDERSHELSFLFFFVSVGEDESVSSFFSLMKRQQWNVGCLFSFYEPTSADRFYQEEKNCEETVNGHPIFSFHYQLMANPYRIHIEAINWLLKERKRGPLTCNSRAITSSLSTIDGQ